MQSVGAGTGAAAQSARSSPWSTAAGSGGLWAPLSPPPAYLRDLRAVDVAADARHTVVVHELAWDPTYVIPRQAM